MVIEEKDSARERGFFRGGRGHKPAPPPPHLFADTGGRVYKTSQEKKEEKK